MNICLKTLVIFTICSFVFFPELSFAQTEPGIIETQNTGRQFRTETNPVETIVGSFVNTGSETANIAIELVNTISPRCNGYLRGSNISCIEGVSFSSVPFPNPAIAKLVSSAQNHSCGGGISDSCLQCVGFVQAVVAGATGNTNFATSGNAKDMATIIPPGYQYVPRGSGNVQPGDIIIKTAGQYGHVAVVTRVYDQEAIQVAEGNFNNAGEIGLSNKATAQFAGWLRKL